MRPRDDTAFTGAKSTTPRNSKPACPSNPGQCHVTVRVSSRFKLPTATLSIMMVPGPYGVQTTTVSSSMVHPPHKHLRFPRLTSTPKRHRATSPKSKRNVLPSASMAELLSCMSDWAKTSRSSRRLTGVSTGPGRSEVVGIT